MARILSFAVVLSLFVGLLAGCGSSGTTGTSAGTATTTTSADPKELTIGFVPSQNADKIAAEAAPLQDYLTKTLGMPVKVTVSTDYIGLVEAMKSHKVDVGFLNPFGYVQAHTEDANIVPILKVVRNGGDTYRSQFIVRKDSGIKSFEDMKGKKLGIVDPGSTSGYLYPAAMLKAKGIDLTPGKYFSDVVTTGSHPNAVKAVWGKQVDVAVSFEDARTIVKKDIPTVMDDLVQIAFSGNIPNDGVSVRGGLSPELVKKVTDALTNFASTDDGKKTLKAIYSIDGFAPGKDADYQPVRDMLSAMGLNAADQLKKK